MTFSGHLHWLYHGRLNSSYQAPQGWQKEEGLMLLDLGEVFDHD